MKPAPPSAKTAEWTSDDAINLRNFLGSKTGERLVVHLGEFVPELLGGGDVNAILIRSGEVKGASATLAHLVSLTVEVPDTLPERNPDKHPSLDDESAWDPKTNLPL